MTPAWKYLAGLTFGVSFFMNIQQHQYSATTRKLYQMRWGPGVKFIHTLCPIELIPFLFCR